MSGWVPLHVHSYYSLLQATPSPEMLARRAASEGLTHLALTDTHALYGVVAFAQACRRHHVQPVIGMTIHILNDEPHAPTPSMDASPPGTLVLLAQGVEGYRNLCRLSARLHRDPQHHPQATSLETLAQHAAGLLCITGGHEGWTYHHIATGNLRAARLHLARLREIFGPEDLYMGVEIQTPSDLEAAQIATSLARTQGLHTVAVHPIYTMAPEDVPRLRLLAAIRLNCAIDRVSPTALPHVTTRGAPRDVHWMAPEAMAERFHAAPDVLARTLEVAQRCGTALPDETLKWPIVDLPKGETSNAMLRAQAWAGAEARYGRPLPPQVRGRLDREYTAIAEHGYAPLFLVVADIVRHARRQQIPVSTRGSVANSLVAYSLGITTVDPVAHDLLFERFLNPGRSDPPDIDLDLCSRRRDEILDYIRHRYGENQVALVGAMATLRGRGAVRETAKAYKLQEHQIQALLKALPLRYPYSIEPSWDDLIATLPDRQTRQVMRAARGVLGVPHHLSVHAGGVIITPGPLTDFVPVQMTPKGFLTTQLDHESCQAIGLPKLDLLGIRALTVLADAAEQVRKAKPDFTLDAIPPDDAQTADLLARGDTTGVFQCDSIGARRTLHKLRARTVQDLAIANAFFKPGPAMGGQAESFVRRYRGEEPPAYLHPALAPILARTKGVLIFQEQVLRVVTEIAGLSWTQADHIRRGMSKMRPEEMEALQQAFIAGCQRPDGPGLSIRQAQLLWEQIQAFSGYGFNQGHATAYAEISYRSAYMKAHFPAAFFWARLRNYGGYHHPAVYMAEALRWGIEIRPPHINTSTWQVHLTQEASLTGPQGSAHPVIWLGLNLVRDLRRHAVQAILKAREAGPFLDVRDLLLRVDLQSKEITHLIQCGALDGLGINRQAMIREALGVTRAGSARQFAFDFAAPEVEPPTYAQRLQWERHILGYPIGVLREWLPQLQRESKDHRPLSAYPSASGYLKTVAVRLPGRHRRGFAVWDGETWLWAVPAEGFRVPPAWDPVLFEATWRTDRWGTGWLQPQGWRPLLR